MLSQRRGLYQSYKNPPASSSCFSSSVMQRPSPRILKLGKLVQVSGIETETSLYAEKASDVKAAEEVDLSIESHTEEVETENTVLVKNSIAFECDECSYRNNSEKGLHKHKRMKHRISQTDGAGGLVWFGLV